MSFVKKIKKGYSALFGNKNNQLYVKKNVGQNWSTEELGGFYIDYSKKTAHKNFDENGIPLTVLSNGRKVPHLITIIQYGLGAYEKHLSENGGLEDCYKICDYLIENQNENGAFEAYQFIEMNGSYSSMVQGEAASLLLRAYKESNKKEYLVGACLAIDFMLKDYKCGGTTCYDDNHVILLEDSKGKPILNGWIYSLFCLYDYYLLTKDERYSIVLNNTVESICELLPLFDRKYWSNYSLDNKIASPMYHELHIKQLSILYTLFNRPEFREYELKWSKCQNSKVKRLKAIIVKAFQKLFLEKDGIMIVE